MLFNLSSNFWPTGVEEGLGYSDTSALVVWAVRFCVLGLLVFTAALTPRSKGMTRGMGYVFASTGVFGFVMTVAEGPGPTQAHNVPLYLTATLLSIATYCYRDITTRRARPAR